MWLLPLSNMAKSCGLYSFVFLGFINDSPLAFSCELCANSWKLPSVYQKGRQTLSKAQNLEKRRPVLIPFCLYFAVTWNCNKQMGSQKALIFRCNIPFERNANLRILENKRNLRALRHYSVDILFEISRVLLALKNLWRVQFSVAVQWVCFHQSVRDRSTAWFFFWLSGMLRAQ